MRTQIAIGEVLAILLPIFFLSGCLSSAEIEIEPYEPELVQSVNDNQSHQYWNEWPLGMGNISEITLNGSGELTFTLELTGFFHESVLWERGYVNYTVSQGNETLFSVQINQTIETYSFVRENMSGNITVEIQSTGSDDPNDQNPGDFYIARATFELKR
tara:strand:- start:57 stop:533 length:477 start_codon:yes stop_codon:yes gene_type:complete